MKCGPCCSWPWRLVLLRSTRTASLVIMVRFCLPCLFPASLSFMSVLLAVHSSYPTAKPVFRPFAAGAGAAGAAEAVAVTPQQGPEPSHDDKTRAPILVSSLDGHAASPAPHLPAHMVPEHMGAHVETSLDRVQDRIHGYEEMLSSMSKQLEETMKQSTKLKLTKSLMSGILALKRAERVLQAIDAAVARAKDKIKHAGERADEIAEHIKRSEVEHRKEVAAQQEALAKLRSGLAKYEKRLTALTARRGRVAGVVRKWKAHVSTLRDAHEAYTAGLVGKGAAAGAGAHANAAAALLGKIPEPPNAADVLAKLGITVPNKGLRGLLRDGKKDPVTAAIMKGGGELALSTLLCADDAAKCSPCTREGGSRRCRPGPRAFLPGPPTQSAFPFPHPCSHLCAFSFPCPCS